MSIEEAEYILNEAVIDQPSINSYTYIGAEDINYAIEKILEERVKDEKRIKELEEKVIKERNKFEELIRQKEIEKIKYPFPTCKSKRIYLRNIFKYVRKVVKPLFLLENKVKLIYNPKV